MHVHAAYPQPQAGHFSSGCLFGLAPDGVCTATCITADAVSSYLAFSPLPLTGRYVFCCTFHRLAAPGCYPASCPAVSGLSSQRCTDTIQYLYSVRMLSVPLLLIILRYIYLMNLCHIFAYLFLLTFQGYQALC